jgi:molecular chaperone GrpE
LIEGVHATERVLAKALQPFGVERIVAIGERFDPNRHEAVMEVEDASRPAGTVTNAVEEGLYHPRSAAAAGAGGRCENAGQFARLLGHGDGHRPQIVVTEQRSGR